MDYIQGKPRSQIVLFESFLEEKIDPDNPVRIIDTFVNNWKLKRVRVHSYQTRPGRKASRKLPIRQQILEVCYNIQTSVDDKHYLPIDFKTTNNNDTHALANMTARAKSILVHSEFIELADKGNHTSEEIRRCHELGVETLVAIPKTPA